jgi:acyl carrier protein
MNTMDNIETSVQSIFHRIFDSEDIVLRPEMTAFDIEGWDSLTHIKIILAIEKHYSVKFKASEVVALKNVGDLFNKVREKVKAKAV